MEYALPDELTVKAALALAVRAPSVYDTQPWLWRIGTRAVHLYLDPALPSTYADHRDLVLSCGVALHHLRIAFAALGWSAVVHRLPKLADTDHLASIELIQHRPTPIDYALSAAIGNRRTDRRPYSSRPVPPGYLGLVTERAATLGATVRPVINNSHDRLVDAIHAAAEGHSGDADYRSESDFAELLVLGTTADDRRSRLCAGEALSAVLLTATNVGLATCLLAEPLESPDLRRRVRVGVLDDRAFPQAVIRIGWAPTGGPPLTGTPRRAIYDGLDAFETAEMGS